MTNATRHRKGEVPDGQQDGAKRELRALPEHLWEGETVERITSGTYGNGTGIIVATDRRLLFLKDGMMSETSEDFPYDKISSIQWSTGMLLGTITVFVSGNKSEIRNVGKNDGKAIVDLVRNRTSNKSAPVTAQPAPSQVAAGSAAPAQSESDVILDQLKKLGDLREAGILTEDEFSAKKVDLLGRL